MSQWLTQKEPVRYTNKLIKKTTDTKLQRILAVTKNLILANITMNCVHDGGKHHLLHQLNRTTVCELQCKRPHWNTWVEN